MTGDPFTHDPTDSRNVAGDAPGSFEQAKDALENNNDVGGLGFVVTRHDPFLVLEIMNGRVGEDLAPSVESILSTFGTTFTENGDEGLLRLFYRGELPGELHGADPVVVTVGGEERNHVFRFFDSGWTPVTGEHIKGTPRDTEPIDDDALRRFLSKAGDI